LKCCRDWIFIAAYCFSQFHDRAHKLDSNNQVTKTKGFEVPSPLRPAKTLHVILDDEQAAKIEQGLDEEDDLRAIMADADDRLAADIEATRRKKWKQSKQEARERARAEGRRSPAKKDDMYLDMRHKHNVLSRAEMKKTHFCVVVYRPQDDDNEEVRAACTFHAAYAGTSNALMRCMSVAGSGNPWTLIVHAIAPRFVWQVKCRHGSVGSRRARNSEPINI